VRVPTAEGLNNPCLKKDADLEAEEYFWIGAPASDGLLDPVQGLEPGRSDGSEPLGRRSFPKPLKTTNQSPTGLRIEPSPNGIGAFEST